MDTLKHIEYIFVMTSVAEFPTSGVELARLLANAAEKPICLLTYLDTKCNTSPQQAEQVLDTWSRQVSESSHIPTEYFVLPSREEFPDFMRKAEASTVIFALSENPGFNRVRTFLRMTRDLRIPYIFVKPYFDNIHLRRILVPVTFLIEDREKGPFANNIGKAFGSEILMMTANDYGHKAKATTQAIETVLEKNGVTFRSLTARKDSAKVDLEAVERAPAEKAGLVIMSASRSYGLDDILFGPKELHCINRTDVPLMLINPRSDLYVLCG